MNAILLVIRMSVPHLIINVQVEDYINMTVVAVSDETYEPRCEKTRLRGFRPETYKVNIC